MEYSVVIIDDNTLIIEALVKTVNWSELKCKIVGTANDGIEGKNIITKYNPDIIISDIKMPGLDGLTMLKLFKNSHKKNKIILITGYQDFNYAQEGIRLGVSDLILKPINNRDLIKSIKNLVEEFEKENLVSNVNTKILSEKIMLENEIRDSIPKLRKNLIVEILNGKINENTNEKNHLEKLKLSFKSYVLFILKLTDYSEVKLLKMASKIEGLTINDRTEIVVNMKGGNIVITMFFKDLVNSITIKNLVNRFSYELDLNIEGEEIKYLIGVSSSYKNIYDLNKGYMEAGSIILKNSFKLPDKSIIFSEDSINNDIKKFSTKVDIEGLANNLLAEKGVQFENLIISFLDNLNNYSDGNMFLAKGIIYELCLQLKKIQSNINVSDVDYKMLLNNVDKLTNFNNAKEFLILFLNDLKIDRGIAYKSYSLLVKNVLTYIQNNISENITLKETAIYFCVSPSYLSNLIKKETGENFVAIVSKSKIEMAKILLKNPKYNVSEIGNKLGYSDYAYFYQVFKKYSGMSPKTYKEKH